MKKLIVLVTVLAISVGALPMLAQADLLAHESVSVTGTGGSGGSGTSASDMVFSTYGSDGWGWAGGAGGVQGSSTITNTGLPSAPANEVLRFNVGSISDSLNAAYGVGNWTITNLTLSFASSYAKQNNSRFGVGNGTFDIYWVGNDNWAQSKGTATDHELNPIYASTADALASWSGTQALLGSETFSGTYSGTTASYVNLTYSLASDSAFVNDILSASATGSNQAASLYLMATADTLGMIIFSGGQGQALPTLSFDVVTTPIPPAFLLFGSGLLGLVGIKRRSIRA